MITASYVQDGEEGPLRPRPIFRQIDIELVGLSLLEPEKKEALRHTVDLYREIRLFQNEVGRKVEKIVVEKKRNNSENLMIYFFEAD